MNKNIQAAKEFCEKNKYRFTQPREQVLEAIFNQDTPLSAYDILEILSVEKTNKSSDCIQSDRLLAKTWFYP